MCEHGSVFLPQGVVSSATNRSLALLGTLATVVAHDDEIRWAGQGGTHATLRVEVNGVHHLVHYGVDGIATTINKVQGKQRTGDSADQLTVVLGLEGLVSPTGRLEIGIVCKNG